jgi:NAD(P)-dependent dehydrogenase (short-subunit alcohol dehydrogenase family)
MKTWFITGASRGFGLRIAQLALARGDNVIATARRKAAIIEVLGEQPSLLALALALKTVEGNTNPTGSSNGLGVFELNRRKVMDPTLKGFLDFT